MVYIFCHIVPDCPVAACERPEKLPVPVCQAYCRAVEFEFGGKSESVSYAPGCPVCKCLHFGDVICVAEGKHRIAVGILGEFLLPGSRFPGFGVRPVCQVASDPHGRGVFRHEFRVLLFEGDQLVHQHVVFIVADDRAVLHIISAVVLVDQIPQFPDAYPCLFLIHLSIK